jgi:hypothetical protein
MVKARHRCVYQGSSSRLLKNYSLEDRG